MIIWGKLIGAFFGFLLTGGSVLGAFIGFLIGSLFDRGLAQQFRHPGWAFSNQQSSAIKHAFFKATFLVMGHVAKSDGRVSENEIRAARSIMDRMNLNEAQRQEAIRYFNQGKQPDFNLELTLEDLRSICRSQLMLLHMFIDIQHQFAEVDGVPNQAKQRVLKEICLGLGFQPYYQYQTDDFFHRSRREQRHSYQHGPFHSKPHNTLDDAYQKLEIPKTASNGEVKKAYRKLMSQNHPDKLIAQGLPDEMIRLATDKTQKIRAAYEQICAARGM